MLNKNNIQLLVKAQKARDKKDYTECIRLCRAFLKKHAAAPQAFELIGLSALELHDFYLAESAGREATSLQPSNPNGALITSVALTSRSQDKDAIEVLEAQLSRTPDIQALLFNLHSCYANLGENQKAIEIAMKTVELNPTNADAFNNLGASLHAVNRLSDAAIAFRTAIELNPKQYTARMNLANTMVSDDRAKINEINQTLEMFGHELPERVRISSLHNTAFAYLRLGDLKNGWERLENGFSPLIDSSRGRRPQRTFEVPRWKGEPLNGKTLLVWREQGLGDELMFGSVLPELLNLQGNIIYECEPRLQGLLSRSFPEFTVRPELYRAAYPHDSPNTDFDLQIPIGSLGGIFRQTVADFDRSKAYLKADPLRVAAYAERLAGLPPGVKKIGLCWRSGVVSPTRGTGYTHLTDWMELLTQDDVCVVNLQYGKCEEELLDIEKATGKKVWRWQDIDLQNDQEAVAALIANLDVVCSVGTAVAQMSGALGVPTLMCAGNYGYTSFGTNRFLYAPDIHLIVDEKAGDMQVAVQMAVSVVKQMRKE